MIRTALTTGLLFALPFVLYFLWLGLQRRRYAEEAIAQRSHLVWVAAAGFVLAVIGFVYFTDFGGASPDAVYVPPRYEDGKLVPGHFE